MSDEVIRVEKLSKRYRISDRRSRAGTLRDRVTELGLQPFHRLFSLLHRPEETASAQSPDQNDEEWIWALKDVSFEIKQGEIIGIIGRNGAGKSTLLKILSRITRPTAGRATIQGRVGTLLEVGTGFHPELTGRENVYLNGAILGMKRAEIVRKFDEIVAFAEVEKFIDMPVKRYSSGMYVRLAFAVAAHLEPEILFVDEVLAVGDGRFATKCMQKIRTLCRQGMTIILVSHSMWQIQTVCTRAICLHNGKIASSGSPLKVIADYRAINDWPSASTLTVGSSSRATSSIPVAEQQASAEILSVDIDPDETWSAEGKAHPESGIHIRIRALAQNLSDVRFFARVTNRDWVPYFTLVSEVVPVPSSSIVGCDAWLPHLMLLPDSYILWAGVCMPEDTYTILAENSIPIEVELPGRQRVDMRHSTFWNRAEWRALL